MWLVRRITHTIQFTRWTGEMEGYLTPDNQRIPQPTTPPPIISRNRRTGNAKSRKWCWTLNNYTSDDVSRLREVDCKYIIAGEEVGEAGTRHLQGFVYFANEVRFATVKRRLFGDRTHVEISRGTVQQNILYCTKTREQDLMSNDVVHEYGERPLTPEEKGETEVERYECAWRLAHADRLEEIDADIRIKHYGTLKKIRQDAQLATDLTGVEMSNEWYYGPSGTGKSFTARTNHPDAYLKMCNKWWDGYDGHDVVLMEDFDINHKVLCHHIKIWADRYAFPVELKGFCGKIRPKKLIVTSNYHPRDIWTEEMDLEPILRRFKIVHFAEPFQYVPYPVTQTLPGALVRQQAGVTTQQLEEIDIEAMEEE